MKSVAALLALAFLGNAGCSRASGEASIHGTHGTPVFRWVGRFLPPDRGGADIVAVDASSSRLVYIDADRQRIGIVDISSPVRPFLVRELAVSGEPTSVAVMGSIAVVTVKTTRPGARTPEPPQGKLLSVDLVTAALSKEVAIAGEPDSVALTAMAGRRTAIVAVENEPILVDERGYVVKGSRPGLSNDVSPPGHIEVVALDVDGDAASSPTSRSRRISLDERRMRKAGCLFPYDPQPEYVHVSRAGDKAAVTLQENNCVAVVDLSDPYAPKLQSLFALGRTMSRFSDVSDDGTIALVDRYPEDVLSREPLSGMRMPDAVAFDAAGSTLYTADEGEPDLTGGRGFSAWSLEGDLLWDDRGTLESIAAAKGFYRDEASDDRGIEVEGLATGIFRGRELLFASAERGGFVAVYDIARPESPRFLQLLSTGDAPEGVLPVPERGLLLTGDEGRGRNGGSVSIFTLDERFTAATVPLEPDARRVDVSTVSGAARSR